MTLPRPLARWVLSLTLLAFAHGPPAHLAAQEEGPLRLTLRASDGGVDAALVDVLSDGATRSSLEAGLPLRILVVIELWRDRFFDSEEGRFEWRATVRYDPLAETYRVETAEGVALRAGSLEGVDAYFAGVPLVPLAPGGAGRFYYLGRLEVETLSASDLDELRRWLQGDLGPAIDGSDAQVGSAIGRGISRLFLSALRLPIRRFETRTPAFVRP